MNGMQIANGDGTVVGEVRVEQINPEGETITAVVLDMGPLMMAFDTTVARELAAALLAAAVLVEACRGSKRSH